MKRWLLFPDCSCCTVLWHKFRWRCQHFGYSQKSYTPTRTSRRIQWHNTPDAFCCRARKHPVTLFSLLHSFATCFRYFM